MLFNSDDIKSVDITWKDDYKHIVVYLNNGDAYSIKSADGVKR